MRERDPFENLDSVLNIFIHVRSSGGRVITGIKESLQAHSIEMTDRLLLEILNKLVKDEYLRTEKPEETLVNGRTFPGVIYYYLTFEGELFQLQGGYCDQLAVKLREENHSKSYEKRLLYGTWAAGIGAIGIVIWEMVKTFVLNK